MPVPAMIPEWAMDLMFIAAGITTGYLLGKRKSSISVYGRALEGSFQHHNNGYKME